MGSPIETYTGHMVERRVEPNFPNMAYDQDTTIPLMEEIQNLGKTILNDVDDVCTEFKSIQRKYDEFTGFDDQINRSTTKLRENSNNIKDKIDQVMRVLSENLTQLAQQDEELKEDLETLNNLLINSGTTE